MKANAYNDYKIINFPDKIQAFRHGRITAPIYVRIKPTNRCNHGCSWCTYSDGTKRPLDHGKGEHLQTGMHSAMRERDMMPIGKALELLGDLYDMGTHAVTFSGGGEPLMHPEIVAMLNRCAALGIDYSIITNGQILRGDRATALLPARWVRVSMDYTNAEQMAKSRNTALGMFGDVMANLMDFAGIKPATCDLGVNFIVTRENHNGLVEFARTLRTVGVENVRFSPVYVRGFREYHAPIAESVRRQLQEAQALCHGGFSINTTYDIDSPGKQPVRPFTRCLYAQTVPVVGADLNVYPCHNTAYSAAHVIGSIADQSGCTINPEMI
jgi:MoaA/NifB/PqqE/SkfB family radical SAM enzyme